LEALKVDELLDTVEDILNKMIPSLFEKDEGKKKEMREKLAKEDFPTWLGNVEKRLEKFGKGPHAVGDHLTIADLKLGICIDRMVTLDHIPPTIADKYTRVKEVQKCVDEHLKVKEWKEKHK